MASDSQHIVQRNVKLSKSDLDWFDEHYPHSSLSGILGMMLSRFRMLHSENTPSFIIAQAAQDVKEEIE